MLVYQTIYYFLWFYCSVIIHFLTIFILHLGEIHDGDQILEVNGQLMQNVTYERFVLVYQTC